jgi:hypothetical protein
MFVFIEEAAEAVPSADVQDGRQPALGRKVTSIEGSWR